MPDTRPFRILGVAQVAIGGLDRAVLRHLWEELLGLRVTGTVRNEAENVEEDLLHAGEHPGDVEVALMTPLDPERPPRVHVPALNHVGLWVDDLPAAVAWLEQRGVRFTPGGIRTGASGHSICFIHPKGDEQHPVGGGGVLIELVAAPQALLEGGTGGVDASPG